MKRFLLITLLLVMAAIELNAAFIKNYPVKLIQPDGSYLHCFASGDEYYNWLHDENNFTIIRNRQNGFYCYAILIDEILSASDFVAGVTDPFSAGLTPGINISSDRVLKIRKEFHDLTPVAPGLKNGKNSKNFGNMNNLVVYIRFNDEQEFADDTTLYYNFFNGSPGMNSMKNYFSEVSYNNLFIHSSFFPKTLSNFVVSYKDSYNRSYYQPYDPVYNPDGYEPWDRTAREHQLLANAVNFVSAQIPSGLNIDYNSDGYVDNVCFIVRGSPTAWSTLLWPHRWSLYSQSVYINGLQVWDYNFQLQEHLMYNGNGVLCHEMFHTLGAPDLYHYNQDGLTPVGVWDLMENNQEPPQHMCAYMKYRYGGWIPNIPEISAKGTYNLNPLTSSTVNCYRINSPNSSTEYFVVEYRQKTGTFESSLPGSGLIVYRINTSFDGMGNAAYDGGSVFDEVYVYRPYGTVYSTGQPDNAYMSAQVNRKKINDFTDPSSFLYDGSPGGLNISSVSYPGNTISFDLNGGPDCNENILADGLLFPASGCFLGKYEPIGMIIKNAGLGAVNPGFAVSYSVDDAALVNEIYNGQTINPGASVLYTFSQKADLSERRNYKIAAATSLNGDCNVWNDTLSIIVTNGQFDYNAYDVINFTDTYIDLGNDGSVISTADFDNSNSSPVNIGFDFGYNCDMFSEFVLNTNGFIRLGKNEPSADSLFFNSAIHSGGGVFNSKDTSDINIIAPFNHDLAEGTGYAEYRVHTSGTAPDRICIIQFKNLKDNTTNPASQYDNIEFQIKLYESSHIIDFVYGNWQPSTESSAFKTAACGLKGSGNLPGQLLVARKGSMTAWENVIFENVNYSSTATLNFGNPPTRPAPEEGRTFRFIPGFIVTGSSNAGIVADELTAVKVFPNPSNGLINIDLPLENVNETNVRVFDVRGNMIKSYSFGRGLNNIKIDLHGYPSGYYLLMTESGGLFYYNKLLLVR